jgi:hypothetical protein
VLKDALMKEEMVKANGGSNPFSIARKALMGRT